MEYINANLLIAIIGTSLTAGLFFWKHVSAEKESAKERLDYLKGIYKRVKKIQAKQGEGL